MKVEAEAVKTQLLENRNKSQSGSGNKSDKVLKNLEVEIVWKWKIKFAPFIFLKGDLAAKKIIFSFISSFVYPGIPEGQLGGAIGRRSAIPASHLRDGTATGGHLQSLASRSHVPRSSHVRHVRLPPPRRRLGRERLRGLRRPQMIFGNVSPR